MISPVLSTALYFIVFGAAVGSRMQEVGGVSYGGFITPGLIMLALITQCISNGSVGIYFPKFTGTIYEILSAPIAMSEILVGYVGAAATKGMMIGLTQRFSEQLSAHAGFGYSSGNVGGAGGEISLSAPSRSGDNRCP